MVKSLEFDEFDQGLGTIEMRRGQTWPHQQLSWPQMVRQRHLSNFLRRHGFVDEQSPRGLCGKVRLELMYPIHVAAQMGDVPILRILLDLGVDPQTGAADGRTARHFAEEANRDGSHHRILQLLAHSQRVKSVAL
ncbi:unnamed protein product [Cladocopium goreaui]|uniref:Uncharacterized protein n=1 Tax=Cladocopium goreaui TaxID=2562237 RepID=A0A9P1BS33_9DINO|nr:unnamed protein product [Cladocopium goreaui]|mmetsp:Transcript_7471/g.16954  ORF Transcript_7471/g.16954 Transcript_7471/m.16954 type:complete len:135 (+) Transcript_7471:66-470(+)